jgi:O-antigen/teichoic acid export membrane protein
MPITTSALMDHPEAVERQNCTRNALGIFGRNTLWLWVDRGALKTGTMIAGLFLVRYFGPTNFGIYSIAIATGTFANAILDLGLTRYAARIVAADPEEGRPTLALSVLVTFVSAAVEAVLVFILAHQGLWYGACLCTGLILCNVEGTNSLCSFMLTADFRSRAVLPGSLLGASGLIALAVVVIRWRQSVFFLLAGLTLRSFLVLGVRLSQLRKFFPASRDLRFEECRRVVKKAWPFFSYSLTELGYSQIPILCLTLVASKQSVGFFAAAMTVIVFLPQLAWASTDALLPVMTRLHEAGRYTETQALRQQLLDLFFLFTLPIVILLSMLAPEVCTLLGARFASAAPVLRIISFRGILLVLEGLGGAFLVAANLVTQRRNMLACAAVLLTLLTLFFGHLWGAEGAAIAAVVAHGLLLCGYLYAFTKAGFNLRPGRAVWSSLAGGLAMMIATPHRPSPLALLYVPPVAIAIYCAVLVLIGRKTFFEACKTLRVCFGSTCALS